MSVSSIQNATPQSVLAQAIVGDNSSPTTKAQGIATLQDLSPLGNDPNNQAAQSKVSTDISGLAEAEGYSTSDINAIGEAASNLSPDDINSLLGHVIEAELPPTNSAEDLTQKNV